jgi:hypothetical protein
MASTLHGRLLGPTPTFPPSGPPFGTGEASCVVPPQAARSRSTRMERVLIARKDA